MADFASLEIGSLFFQFSKTYIKFSENHTKFNAYCFSDRSLTHFGCFTNVQKVDFLAIHSCWISQSGVVYVDIDLGYYKYAYDMFNLTTLEPANSIEIDMDTINWTKNLDFYSK